MNSNRAGVKRALDPETARLPKLNNYQDSADAYDEYEDDQDFYDWDDEDDFRSSDDEGTDYSDPGYSDYDNSDYDNSDYDYPKTKKRKPAPAASERYEEYTEGYSQRDAEKSYEKEEKSSIGFFGYLVHMILFSIPAAGLIIALVFSFTGKKEKKAFARAFIVYALLMTVIISGVVYFFYK